MAGFAIARIVTAGVLLVALGKLPYAYYTLTRFVCCLVAGYGAYLAFERKQQPWMWAFGATALLFNPFAPIRLDKSTWAVLDMAAAIFMLSSLTNRALSDRNANVTGEPSAESGSQRPMPIFDAEVADIFVCPNPTCGHRNRVQLEDLKRLVRCGNCKTELILSDVFRDD